MFASKIQYCSTQGPGSPKVRKILSFTVAPSTALEATMTSISQNGYPWRKFQYVRTKKPMRITFSKRSRKHHYYQSSRSAIVTGLSFVKEGPIETFVPQEHQEQAVLDSPDTLDALPWEIVLKKGTATGTDGVQQWYEYSSFAKIEI